MAHKANRADGPAPSERTRIVWPFAAVLMFGCGDNAATTQGGDGDFSTDESPVAAPSSQEGDDKPDPMQFPSGHPNRIDAGTDADAGAHDAGAEPVGDFCERVPEELCADFEDEGLEAWSWSEIYPDSPSAISVAEVSERPGKRVFKSQLSGVGLESARTVQALPANLSRVHIEFDFRPEIAPPADAAVVWFRLTQQSGADDYPGVSLANTQGGTILMVQAHTVSGDSYDEYDLPSPPTDWGRVTLDFTLGPNGSASVRYDDGPTWQQGGLALQSIDVQQSFVQFGLYTQSPSHSTALYDDIVASYEE